VKRQPHVLVFAPSSQGGLAEHTYYRLAALVRANCDVTCLTAPSDNADLADYFAAADFILLTYAATFHSQSGVLNIAARAHKPVLASAAPGPLVNAVKNFKLGEVVAPDDADAITAGMRTLLVGSKPDWDEYARVHSWDRNAQKIMETAGLS
jgi:hypothetical protein